MTPKKALIIGGGPAGLTVAYELLKHTSIQPVVVEMSEFWGGISRTESQNGNRMDIGGHRFFSKSDEVMNWWQEIMPVWDKSISPEPPDKVLLIRQRQSRIFYNKHFFDYPVSLNMTTIKNLGFVNMFFIGTSYLKTKLLPPKNIETLEDFFISRFGNRLYQTFFKDYTEKVWGVSCRDIPAEWGKQRIKGLSITKTLLFALKKMFKKTSNDIAQKGVETSLIEQFLYPKFGPGQMWETVAEKITNQGGILMPNCQVTSLKIKDRLVTNAEIIDKKTGKKQLLTADYVISSMPVKHLVEAFDTPVPQAVKDVASNLQYRDFITVGLLLKNINYQLQDNWIYIQENYVKLGRLQIFNNWSPFMLKNKDYTWVGLEYFCNKDDELWNLTEDEMTTLAVDEMIQLGFINDKKTVLDHKVIKVPKAYPAYFGTYKNFDVVKNYLNQFENLFLVGRNGMHKYNNQDHSMLTAMQTVQNIKNGKTGKENIWQINTEDTYHEEK